MAYLALHLSDFHIKEGSRLRSPKLVVNAINAHFKDLKRIIIIVSGDISFSGAEREFMIASRYFDELKSQFEATAKAPVDLVFIPGNHDLQLTPQNKPRQVVLESIRRDPSLLEDEEIVATCVAAQNNFFAFLKDSFGHNKDKLCWPKEYLVDTNLTIYIRCINTAYASQLSEAPGSMVFPIKNITTPPLSAITISVMHHPYNWFEVENSHELRGHLENTSDIILTGHEHDGDHYLKRFADDREINYIEGKIFYDKRDNKNSGFYALEILSETDEFLVTEFAWQNTLYAPVSKPPLVRPFIRKFKVGELGVVQRKLFKGQMNSLGVDLTHRAAKTLTLEDLFIMPRLRRYKTLEKNEELPFEIIDSEKVFERLLADKFVYLTGDARSGKTSLAKRIYSYCLSHGALPIYISGSEISIVDGTQLEKLFQKAFLSQYELPDYEHFLQLDRAKKVLIVDDLYRTPINNRAQAQVCNQFVDNFGAVFIVGNEWSQVEELLIHTDVFQALDKYAFYEIIEFGPRLREKLIDKWLLLGKENLIEEADYRFDKAKIVKLVETLLGKSLIPYYPINILMILQQIEANIPLNTVTGSLGYFYQLIISHELLQTSKYVQDLDTKLTYISGLAWRLYIKGDQDISEEDYFDFSKEYTERYLLATKDQEIFTEVKESRIFIIKEGRIRFRYPYYYYYFVARYMSRNKGGIIDRKLNAMLDDIHREDYANIVIFLTYLSGDESLIDSILKKAKSIFKDTEPCNIESHIDFVNKLQTLVPEILLPAGEPEEHREEWLKEREAIEESDKEISEINAEEERELGELLNFNRAMKTLQIMGQIARNFSGTLPGEIKKRIVQESFLVSFRALNFLYRLLEKDLDKVMSFCEVLFEIHEKKMTEKERIDYSQKLVFILCVFLCVSMVKRISEAVGSDKLMPTFDELWKASQDLASDFVQAEIRLENSKSFPEKVVLELAAKVRDNSFAETTLRILVANHLLLNPVPVATRQRICDKLDIKTDKKLLAGKLEA